MRKLLLILVIAALHSITASCQLSHVSVEETQHSGIVGTFDLTGYTTYRIFAHTVSPDDEVISVSGAIDQCESYVRTTAAGWFNSSFGGDTGNLMPEIAWVIEESSKYDTYVTVGMASNSSLGVLNSEVENGLIPLLGSGSVLITGDAASEFSQSDVMGISGGNLELDGMFGSSWFSLPNSPNTLPQGSQNSVLIGQFTTDGEFSFALNVQVLGENQTADAGVHFWCGSSSVPGMTFTTLPNCNDLTACNYSQESDSDEQCVYIGDPCDDMNPNTTSDVINDLCDCVGINAGCTDELACNYDVAFTTDDGSCAYPGDPCDDLNDSTIQEVYQDDCSCSGGIIGISEIDIDGQTILLYPNPMTDSTFLEFEDASIKTVRLLDSTGKEVRVWESVSTPRIEISRDQLASGNYVVTVEAGADTRHLQLIIE